MDLCSHHTLPRLRQQYCERVHQPNATSTEHNFFNNIRNNSFLFVFLPKTLWENCHCLFCGLFCCAIFWNQFVPMGNLSLPFLWAFLLCNFLESICTHRKPDKMQQRNFVINDGLTGVFKHTIPLKLSTTVVQLNHRLSNECLMHCNSTRIILLVLLLAASANKIMLICTSSIINY